MNIILNNLKHRVTGELDILFGKLRPEVISGYERSQQLFGKNLVDTS